MLPTARKKVESADPRHTNSVFLWRVVTRGDRGGLQSLLNWLGCGVRPDLRGRTFDTHQRDRLSIEQAFWTQHPDWHQIPLAADLDFPIGQRAGKAGDEETTKVGCQIGQVLLRKNHRLRMTV